MIELRYYQRKIMNDPVIVKILYHLIGNAERPNVTRPLVVAPTGAGKTAMFSATAKWCREHRLRVLVLTHRREILQQTIKSMHRLDVTCGQIISGRPQTSDLIQVASVQTLVRRLELVKRPDLIITDEAHHTTTNNTWGRIHQYWSTVPNIGFSATPERLDGVGLGDCYDTMILGPTIRELVNEGWLSMPHMLRQPDEVATNYHIKRGDFDQAEQFQTMSSRKIVGDVIAHYREHLDGQPVIVSCVSVEHAHLMAEQFRSAGYVSKAVWGDMDDDDRVSAIEGLGNGSVQVVTFADLIGEGVDIPAVSGVIMLRRTMSLSLYLQIVGRALRPVYAPGFDMDTVEGRRAAQLAGPKPRATILDHAGNYHLHGHVLADRAWSLDSTRRTVKGEAPPTTTTCPKCYGIWPGKPRTCPACGFSWADAERVDRAADIKIIAGQLVEAGIDEIHADSTAQFVAAALRADAKTRQKMLLGRAFALAGDGEQGRATIKALTKAVGYNERWSDWAWKYAQSNSR
jgi:DNA repair protein RadD